MQQLIDQALIKFKTARRIAVENFTESAPADKTANNINLSADSKSYKWNRDTVSAIRHVLKSLGRI